MGGALAVVRVTWRQFFRSVGATACGGAADRAWAVGIAEGCVALALGVLGVFPVRPDDEAEDGIAARRIAGDGQRVAVVRGHKYQRVLRFGHGNRLLHRFGEGDGVRERAVGIAGVMGVVDAPALGDEQEPLFAFFRASEARDGEARHGGERGFAAEVRCPVRLELHVRLLEQAEHLALRRQRLESGQVVDVAPPFPRRKPLRGQIAPVPAVAVAVGLFRIGGSRRQEHRPAAAEHHVHAVAIGKLHQLPGDVRANALRFRRHGRLPVAVGGVGVGGGGGRMGDPRRAHDAGLEAALLGFLQQRRQFMLAAALAVAAFGLRADAEHASARSLPRDQRRHGAGRVRHLGIDVVGLHQGDVGEALEREQVLLAAAALVLAVEDARRGDRGDAHAVAHEENHVARLGGGSHCRHGQCHAEHR